MGADIKGTIEVMMNGEWRFYKRIAPPRWYTAIAKLTNRRNAPMGHECHVQPYKENTGIPEDATKETMEIINRYGCERHSHTTYSLEELEEVFKQPITRRLLDEETGERDWYTEYVTPKNVFGECGNDIMSKYRGPRAIPGCEDVRVIIWIDN
jgi:hypothetical protein